MQVLTSILSRTMYRCRRLRTLRGLHFQKTPFAQVKLVSVMQGAARDVVVDLRQNSRTFGRHFSIFLSGEEGNQIYVPIGFAHGFLDARA